MCVCTHTHTHTHTQFLVHSISQKRALSCGLRRTKAFLLRYLSGALCSLTQLEGQEDSMSRKQMHSVSLERCAARTQVLFICDFRPEPEDPGGFLLMENV